jgi:glycosyl hydrolase family 71
VPLPRLTLALALTGLVLCGAFTGFSLAAPAGCKGKKPCVSTRSSTTAATSTSTSASPSTSTSATGPHMLAYYYLWWSTAHWHDQLGASFPYTAKPLPLPASLDATGCSPVSLFPGNHLTDTPAALWTQDDPSVIEKDVRTAAAAGLAGFIVNWAGTGAPDQTVASISYSRRLDAMFQAVHKVNAEGIPFKLWISLKTASKPTAGAIANDLAYLVRQYGNDSAYDHTYSYRPILLWTGSRKYSRADVATISSRFRSSFFIVGDETSTTWADGRSAYLDGDSYYWSSQNPYTNPRSFTTLKNLAAQVRGSGSNPDGSRKLWLAPVAPGYDSRLIGGSTCVPRNGVQTLDTLYKGNAQSSPDGWTLISWNEIAEGSYVLPMQRWGSLYLDELHRLTG